MLFASGRHCATVDGQSAAGIGGQAGQCSGVTHGPVKSGGACAVDGERISTVHRAAEGDVGCACIQGGIRAQGHGAVVALCRVARVHTAAIECRSTVHGEAVTTRHGTTQGHGAGCQRGVRAQSHGIAVGLCGRCFDAATPQHHIAAGACVSGDAGQKLMAPFSIDLFKGMLAFFLLDMGLMAARNLKDLRGKPPITLLYAIGSPLSHALLALVLCKLIGLPLGNTILLMVLASSASYIAVPAVLRHALPEVNPGLYMGMSLGITFPFNIILGIPLYTMIAKLFL